MCGRQVWVVFKPHSSNNSFCAPPPASVGHIFYYLNWVGSGQLPVLWNKALWPMLNGSCGDS